MTPCLRFGASYILLLYVVVIECQYCAYLGYQTTDDSNCSSDCSERLINCSLGSGTLFEGINTCSDVDERNVTNPDDLFVTAFGDASFVTIKRRGLILDKYNTQASSFDSSTNGISCDDAALTTNYDGSFIVYVCTSSGSVFMCTKEQPDDCVETSFNLTNTSPSAHLSIAPIDQFTYLIAIGESLLVYNSSSNTFQDENFGNFSLIRNPKNNDVILCSTATPSGGIYKRNSTGDYIFLGNSAEPCTSMNIAGDLLYIVYANQRVSVYNISNGFEQIKDNTGANLQWTIAGPLTPSFFIVTSCPFISPTIAPTTSPPTSIATTLAPQTSAPTQFFRGTTTFKLEFTVTRSLDIDMDMKDMINDINDFYKRQALIQTSGDFTPMSTMGGNMGGPMAPMSKRNIEMTINTYELSFNMTANDFPGDFEQDLCCKYETDPTLLMSIREDDKLPDFTVVSCTPSCEAPITPVMPQNPSSSNAAPQTQSSSAPLIAIGAALGIIILIIVVVAILVFFFVYKSRNKKNEVTEMNNYKEAESIDTQSDEEITTQNGSISKEVKEAKPSGQYTAIDGSFADLKPQLNNTNVTNRLRTVRADGGEIEDSEKKSSNDNLKQSWMLDYDELKIGKKLGAGSYGVLRKGTWRFNEVAIKFCSDVAAADSFIAEAKLMVELRPHNNVVQVFGVSIKDEMMYMLIMEFMAGGSLDVLLYDPEALIPLENKEKIITGIAKGLHHLHEEGIIHRDLATRNVLLDNNQLPKISDFGMSRLIGVDVEAYGKTKSSVGPVRWMAPENMVKKYSIKSDVWSFGCVLYEIFHELEPWSEEDDLLAIAINIRDNAATPKLDPHLVPSEYQELMKRCWSKSPADRPSMSDICVELTSKE